MSREKILDDIRNSLGADIHREHLMNDQDIRNIGKAFGIDQVKRHENDQDSVLAWIQEWKESLVNPVLFYKLQGEKTEEEKD